MKMHESSGAGNIANARNVKESNGNVKMKVSMKKT